MRSRASTSRWPCPPPLHLTLGDDGRHPGLLRGRRDEQPAVLVDRAEGAGDEASADYCGFSDAGLFTVYASVDPKNAAEVLRIVRQETGRPGAGVDAEALARARTRHATALVCSGENGLHRFSQIVGDISTRTPLKAIEEQIAEIDAVTPGRIAEYLKAYPVDGEPALVALGPMESIEPA